jgi:23S rRNA (uracil1939-C5)-methyltransferase
MTAETFTVTIDTLSYGGRGVGRRQDGKVAFISFVIPGETVLARVEKEHASYCTAEPLEILEKSPERTDPECPLFTFCGGCDWQHIPYPSQLRWKSSILEGEIARSAPRKNVIADAPVPSESAYGYRGHTVLQCRGSSMGFFQKKTNLVIPVERCPVLNARLQALLPGLARIVKESPRLGLHSLELHAPHGEVLLEARCGSADRKTLERFMERMHKELGLAGVSVLATGIRLAVGKEACSYPLTVNGDTVLISSSFGEFIQANMPVNQSLVDHVAVLAQGSRGILDLYCGSGNFSIPLARSAQRVLAVEWSTALVAQGRASASLNGADNIEFMAMDVRKALEELRNKREVVDAVVLDPPREGAKESAPLIPGLQARRIIYISCNPTTLARDLKPLVQSGYDLKGLRLFDMFPQTFHIESVALLERQPSGALPRRG